MEKKQGKKALSVEPSYLNKKQELLSCSSQQYTLRLIKSSNALNYQKMVWEGVRLSEKCELKFF